MQTFSIIPQFSKEKGEFYFIPAGKLGLFSEWVFDTLFSTFSSLQVPERGDTQVGLQVRSDGTRGNFDWIIGKISSLTG